MTQRQREQHLHEWMQSASRFFVLANAGGAVATLSFLGTSMAGGATFRPAVLCLALFAAGVIVAGLIILGQLAAAYRDFLQDSFGPDAVDASMKRTVATRVGNWVEPRTGQFLLLSFGLFVAGIVVGLVALLLFEPTVAAQASESC